MKYISFLSSTLLIYGALLLDNQVLAQTALDANIEDFSDFISPDPIDPLIGADVDGEADVEVLDRADGVADIESEKSNTSFDLIFASRYFYTDNVGSSPSDEIGTSGITSTITGRLDFTDLPSGFDRLRLSGQSSFARHFQASEFDSDALTASATLHKVTDEQPRSSEYTGIPGLTQTDAVDLGVLWRGVFSPHFEDFANGFIRPSVTFSRSNIPIGEDICGSGPNRANCTSASFSLEPSISVFSESGEALDNVGLTLVGLFQHRLSDGSATLRLRPSVAGSNFYRDNNDREDLVFNVEGTVIFPLKGKFRGPGRNFQIGANYTNRTSSIDAFEFDRFSVFAGLNFAIPVK